MVSLPVTNPSPTAPTELSSPTSSSSFSSRIPLPALKAKLQETVKARSTGYSRVSALVAFFEDDDTGAQEDARKLETTLKDILGIDTTIFKIPQTSMIPRWDLYQQVQLIISNYHAPTPGIQTLFIFAFIGHGTLGGSQHQREVLFTAKNGKYISWQQLRHSLLGQDQIDVLAILDCCHSGLIEPRLQVPQTIRVMAACGAAEQARSQQSRATFTQKLCAELRRVPNFNHTYITVDALLEKLRVNITKGSPTPRLLHTAGVKPIMLHFKPSRLPQPVQPKAETQNLLVKLTLTGAEADNLQDFQNFVLGLPAPFRVFDAYKTDKSVLLLLRMTWQTWARLASNLDMKPIGVIIGESLIHKPIYDSPSAYDVSQVDENLSFRARSPRKNG